MAELLTAAGTGVKAVSQYSQGKSAQRQLYRQAGATRASAQRDAIAERKRALLLQSRALAVAAASGAGGVQDPTIEKLIADIGTQGEMNALGSLYEGEETALGMEAEGRARKREGRARAVSTVLSTGADMMGKYG